MLSQIVPSILIFGRGFCDTWLPRRLATSTTRRSCLIDYPAWRYASYSLAWSAFRFEGIWLRKGSDKWDSHGLAYLGMLLQYTDSDLDLDVWDTESTIYYGFVYAFSAWLGKQVLYVLSEFEYVHTCTYHRTTCSITLYRDLISVSITWKNEYKYIHTHTHTAIQSIYLSTNHAWVNVYLK